MKDDAKSIIMDEAEALSHFMMNYHSYYMDLFVNGNLELTQETLSIFPAFSASEVSREFSHDNVQNIEVAVVSDRARNVKNLADAEELTAIKAFERDETLKEYYKFIDVAPKAYYQLAIPFVIEPKCLMCHGKKKDAPSFVQEHYDTAYDYQVGDIRGILSIKIPEGKLTEKLNKTFWLLVVYDTALLVGLFLFIQMLLMKFKQYTTQLQERVNRQNEELLKNLNELNSYKEAIDNSAMVSKSDPDGVITYVNDKFCENIGYSREYLIGKNHSILRDPMLDGEYFKQMWDTIQAKKVWSNIISGKRKDNSAFYYEATITPILDEEGNIKEYIAIRYDATEVTLQRQKIKSMYAMDVLTRIPNRNKLIIDMQLLDEPQIALFNIDGFKIINDFYGIKAGDKLLIQFANFIKTEIAHNKLFRFYRLHSDEFAILGDGTLHIDEFVAVMHSYQRKIEKHYFSISVEQEVSISVTLGFGMHDNALVKADMALKLAQNSKSEYIVYDDSLELEKHYEENIKKANIIKHAIDNEGILTYYQPILDLKSGKKDKYETLVRMRHNDEILSPGAFLHIAKQSRNYFKVTEIMLEEALKQLSTHPVTLSINISIEDIANTDMSHFIIQRLKESDYAEQIIFEILESENIQSYDQVSYFIGEVKKYGAKIAIDDFGSGYSNFLHVLELEADFLKIDGSLIKRIHEDKQSRILVEGIVDFSNRLGMKTIAEFVEDETILAILKEIGVDFAQGYFVGKPTPGIV